ncbi:hypothetical protein [Clostridium amazonitimonense]|nr:hypothetical protein [Clostridium amazonitimonense]
MLVQLGPLLQHFQSLTADMNANMEVSMSILMVQKIIGILVNYNLPNM